MRSTRALKASLIANRTKALLPAVGWLADERQTRETLPALMHDVQTFTRFGVPDTMARTR